MQRDKFFKEIENVSHPNETLVKTHCSYCGMQCGMNLRVNTETNKIIGVEPRYDWPVNMGKMCPKGVTAYQQTNHDDRFLKPLIRDDASLKGTKDGFREATWDEAYDLIAEKVHRAARVIMGKIHYQCYSGVSMTNEKCYLTGKFARVGLQTRYIDYNGRFCMASAAGGFIRSFGVDRGSTFLGQIFMKQIVYLLLEATRQNVIQHRCSVSGHVQERGGYLIVADPRETPIARRADVHLRFKTWNRLALANGILNLLIQNGYADEEFVNNHTNGFEETKELVKHSHQNIQVRLQVLHQKKLSVLQKFTEKRQMRLLCLPAELSSSLKV